MAGGHTFAKGTRAWGICARSGRKMLLRDMVWDGQYPNLKVDPAWYDPKHPQEMLPAIEDPIALANPSPETIAPPSAPVVTLVVASPTEIQVTWTPAESGITDMEEYQITRSVNGAAYAPLETCVLVKDFLDGIIGITHATFPLYPEAPNDPSVSIPPDQPATYRDLTVAFGSTYCYIVEAIPQGNNQYVAQGPPATSLPVCIQVAIPAPVLTGHYNFTSNRVELAYSLPSVWLPNVTQWQIWRQVNGGGFSQLTTVTGPTLTYNDTTANSFLNAYQYFVVAVFAGGNSPNSNTITAPSVITTIFEASSSWLPPPGFQFANIVTVGGGAGGQSGGILDAITQAGGNGGGAGGISVQQFSAATVGVSAVTVTVGAGGAGGVGIINGGNLIAPQVDGQNGGVSSFGAFLVANGGRINNGQVGTQGAGGTGTTQQGGGTNTLASAGSGALTVNGGSPQAAFLGGPATIAPGGGGGGGSGDHFHGGAPIYGQNGGAGQSANTSPSAGGIAPNVQQQNGGKGGDGANGYAGGGGGGGAPGFDNTFTAIAGNGGDGGKYGGGGGGGGNVAAQATGGATQQQGSGGKGGGGVVVVQSFS